MFLDDKKKAALLGSFGALIMALCLVGIISDVLVELCGICFTASFFMLVYACKTHKKIGLTICLFTVVIVLIIISIAVGGSGGSGGGGGCAICGDKIYLGKFCKRCFNDFARYK